ncbi:MAG: NADP-dependent isocitrate dehydrogenase [Planctomycetota bacterium]
MATHKVTLMEGDGIGPEISRSVVQIIQAAGVSIDWERCEAGKIPMEKGVTTGLPDETIASIDRNKVALKAPLETALGYGGKSANVTLRKLFELYGNTRPCRELPGIAGPFAGRDIDLVVVRENVEDLYAGIEHMQTPGVAQCLKLISRKGCEKIVRLAFELAISEGRKKVACASKSNIMKMSEGLMKKTFEDIAPEYEVQGIETEHFIIDNLAHQLVRVPEQFDVIVTTNMNGDIISDLTSGLTGGLGLAPSANIGNDVVMFEAVHGSAPTIAGKDIANPTAFILSACMMLRHLGEFDAAEKVERAIHETLEEGKVLTVDVAQGVEPATTTQYTEAIIANLGKASKTYKARDYKKVRLPELDPRPDFVTAKSWESIGCDLFIESPLDATALGDSLVELAQGAALKLKMISNRGMKVYPAMAGSRTDCIDHWRCRFVRTDDSKAVTNDDITTLVEKVQAKHDWMHIEKLHLVDGERAYSMAQGED